MDATYCTKCVRDRVCYLAMSTGCVNRRGVLIGRMCL